MKIAILLILCLVAMLCAAPLTLDIWGKDHSRLGVRFRYLCFCRSITRVLRNRLRRLLKSPDFFKTLKLYFPLFRKPLRVKHLRLNLAFSTGDAAETAVFHGCIRSLANVLYPLAAGSKPEITLKPRFSAKAELCFDCNMSFSIPAAILLFRIISLSAGNKGNFIECR